MKTIGYEVSHFIIAKLTEWAIALRWSRQPVLALQVEERTNGPVNISETDSVWAYSVHNTVKKDVNIGKNSGMYLG